jgi:hypothetical protein
MCFSVKWRGKTNNPPVFYFNAHFRHYPRHSGAATPVIVNATTGGRFALLRGVGQGDVFLNRDVTRQNWEIVQFHPILHWTACGSAARIHHPDTGTPSISAL